MRLHESIWTKGNVLVVLAVGLVLEPHSSHQQQQLAQNKSAKNSVSQFAEIFAVQQQVQHGEEPEKDEGTSASLAGTMLKTYIRTNSMRAYHLDLHSYRPGAKFSGDPQFVDSRNTEHLDRCIRHLEVYHDKLQEYKEADPVLSRIPYDAMALADTYGRPESGLLLGSQFWLGSYDSCLDIKNIVGGVGSQYCLGLSRFSNWNPQAGKTSVKVGLCLPETCTSSMLNDNEQLLALVETMMKYQFGSGQPFDRLKLSQVYCLPHETSEVRRYSWSALCLLTILGAIAVTSLLATIIDYLNSRLPKDFKPPSHRSARSKRTIIVESFSLIRNLEKFMSIREGAPPQINQTVIETQDTQEQHLFERETFLNCTTGIKCIGLFWIIAAHCFLVGPITSRNVLVVDNLTKTFLANIYLTAHLMVDTFFTLSGLLASYFIFKEGVDKMSNKQWIVLTIHRYWRLTPIYLFCYWFTKSVGSQIREGPMWDYATAEASPRLNCANESWLTAILHLSDFKSPKEHCVPFAWFIANGIKFWMVTPFFLILIHKSARRGYMVTLAAILVNMVLVTVLALQSNVDMKSVIEFKPESADNMLNNMGEVYTRPYSRIGTYLIGILAGHIMYLLDTNQLEVKLSKHTSAIIWTLFSVTIIVMTFVIKIAGGMELDDRAIPWVFSICAALIRPLWAICTCWFVLALAHGQANWLARFLTANLWRILVKLSFCAYLVQGEVIAQLYLAVKAADTYTYTEMISRPIVTTVLTLAVSFLMVLLLEYPLIGIEELLLPKKQRQEQIETSSTTRCRTLSGINDASSEQTTKLKSS